MRPLKVMCVCKGAMKEYNEKKKKNFKKLVRGFFGCQHVSADCFSCRSITCRGCGMSFPLMNRFHVVAETSEYHVLLTSACFHPFRVQRISCPRLLCKVSLH